MIRMIESITHCLYPRLGWVDYTKIMINNWKLACFFHTVKLGIGLGLDIISILAVCVFKSCRGHAHYDFDTRETSKCIYIVNPVLLQLPHRPTVYL